MALRQQSAIGTGGAVSDCLDCSVLAKRQAMPEKRRFAAVLVEKEKQKIFYESGPGWMGEGVGPLRAKGGANGGGSENIVAQPIAFNGRQDPVNGPVTGALDRDGASQCVAVLGDKTHSLTSEGFDGSEDGTGRGTPIVAQEVYYESGPGFISKGVGCLRAEGENRPSRPAQLNARMGTGGNQIPVLMEPTYAFSAGQSDKARTIGFQEEVSPTLRGSASGTNMTPTVVSAVDCRNNCEISDKSATLQAGGHGYSLNAQNPVRIGYAVRRLTPLECLRLQGFPDNWFDGIKGNSDTACYKATGNSIAIPPVEWIMRRIADIELTAAPV
ncbi:MAG: DNA cytosine methyltransferase [Bacteroidales bacterium]|nr:DNA cytosine methyltransferase [Bacteroidales bacterium]